MHVNNNKKSSNPTSIWLNYNNLQSTERQTAQGTR